MSRAADRAVGGAAALFSALGDRTRLSLVKKLGDGVGRSATQLSHGARVSRQAIAKHLQVLEEAGVVRRELDGRAVLYALEVRRLAEARAFLDGISAGWDRAIARLRRLVETPDP